MAESPCYSSDLTSAPKIYRFYDYFLATFVVVLLISNLVGQKLCSFGPFVVSGAQLLFPFTYIFGDTFTEVYGYSGSRRAIWVGFFACILMALMGWLTVALPPAPGWKNQQAFATVFYQVPRLVAASLVAFWCGEFANSFVMAKMKLWTNGKFLWSRTIGSTVAGQAVDTVILSLIGFLGTVPFLTLLKLMGSAYLFKVVYEIVATPVTYAIVNGLKRAEGLDTFDYDTRFSPFVAEM